MRNGYLVVLTFALMAGLAACGLFESASSAVPTVDGSGSPLASLAAPTRTTKPGFPSPTIEIPPPID